jgi:hypothetical protein
MAWWSKRRATLFVRPVFRHLYVICQFGKQCSKMEGDMTWRHLLRTDRYTKINMIQTSRYLVSWYRKAWTGVAQSIYWLGYRLDDQVSIPGRGRDSLLHRVQTGSGAHPAFYTMGTRGPFSGDKAPEGVKLTTHLHQMPRLRTREVLPPLPHTSS